MHEATDLASLICATIEGSLDDNQRREVARRMATDPEFRQEVIAHMEMAGLVAAHLHGGKNGPTATAITWQLSRRSQSQRAKSLQSLKKRVQRTTFKTYWDKTKRPLAIIAATVAATLLIAIISRPFSSMAPTPYGELIAENSKSEIIQVGDEVTTGKTGRTLLLHREGRAKIDLAPESKLGIISESELVLHTGRLDCTAEPQNPDRPLVFVTGPIRYTVVGTEFSLRRERSQASLEVRHGLVQVKKEGKTAIPVDAGHRIVLHDTGKIELGAIDPAIIDDFSGFMDLDWLTIANSASKIKKGYVQDPQIGKQALNISVDTHADPDNRIWAQIQTTPPSPLNGSAYAGLVLHVKLDGSGNQIAVSLNEGWAAGGDFWRWWISNDTKGWQTITLPWSELTRNSDFKNSKTLNKEFNPSTISMIQIGFSRRVANTEFSISNLGFLQKKAGK